MVDLNKTTVVHFKKQPYNVYIGRPGEWGNPFTIGKDGDRTEVISKYEKWIERKLIDIPGFRSYIIRELKGKVLGCWCHPKKCHGDVLAKICDREVDNG